MNKDKTINRWQMNWVDGIIVALIIAVYILGVWWLMPLISHSDVLWYQDWINAAQNYGYLHLGDHITYYRFNYLSGFKVVIWLYLRFQALIGGTDQAYFINNWRWFVSILSLVLSLWPIIKMKSYLSRSLLLGLAVAWLLNPFFAWSTWVWGQTDLLVLTPWMASLIFLSEKKYGWFLAASIVAFILKPTGIMYLPLQLALLVGVTLVQSNYKSWLYRLTYLGLGLGAIGLIFYEPILNFVHSDALTGSSWLTYNAFNMWFLMRDIGPAEMIYHGLPFVIWGGLITIPFLALIIRWGYKRLESAKTNIDRLKIILVTTIGYAFAITYLMTGIHERYWDFLLAPLLLLTFINKRWAWFTGVATILFTLNIITIFPSNAAWFEYLTNHWIQIGGVLSWLMTLLGLWLVYMVVSQPKNTANHKNI